VQRAANREQALRISGLLGLIYRARFQRHRDRISLVSARIVELSVDQNRYRNQCRFAAADLQKPHRSRPFHLFRLFIFWRLFLGSFLPPLQFRLLRRAS
jgi:hypothetical protein